MTSADSLFSGSIPELYDKYLGPLLFQDYADDLAEQLSRRGAEDVLEIAAGTGIVTRALARLLPAARIAATDLNQAMLDRAAGNTAPSRVAWRQADAQDLPFSDAAFDTVVCQFGLMFFPDRTKAYGQVRRVLKPGGRFLFNVWDRIENNPLSKAVGDALAERYPKDPPRFLERTPYGYFDIGAIGVELEAVGFREIEVTTVPKRSRASSARESAIGLCQGTPLRGEIEARAPGDLAAATNAVAAWLEKQFGAGPIDVPMQAHRFSMTRGP